MDIHKLNDWYKKEQERLEQEYLRQIEQAYMEFAGTLNQEEDPEYLINNTAEKVAERLSY